MRLSMKALIAAGFIAIVMIRLGTVSCKAADPVFVGLDVPPADRVSLDQIDHAPWGALLSRYVDDGGNVSYGEWKQSNGDVQRLNAYLQGLASGDPSMVASRSAQLAFWINAYNAVTVHGILREYPTTSIRNHTAKLFGYNIWEDLQLSVGGKRFSLNQIEHEILRKMDEPRIHFAIVCASLSCPRLLNQAYTSERVEMQLASNTIHFFANPRNSRFDKSSNTLYLSSILKWFAEDFGADRATQLRRIASWMPNEAAKQAASDGNPTVKYLDYDWSLNGR